VLGNRVDSRFRHPARLGQEPDRQTHLRDAGHGLARIGPSLEPVRDCLHAAGRFGHAAGSLRAQRGQPGLCGLGCSRLAHYVLPACASAFSPPYFVAGAIFSGFAMVLILAIPFRYLYHMEDFITLRHLQNCGKVMLATGMIVAYAYVLEMFIGWYSQEKYELAMVHNRLPGPYSLFFSFLIL